MAVSELVQALLTVFALGLIVEGVVFLYQLASASDSRIYAKVLRDQFGAWVDSLLGVGAVEWHSRGPMQFIRLRPQGRLTPLSKEELICAFEEQTSGWFRRALDVLQAEATFEERGAQCRSPQFLNFLQQLGKPESSEEMPKSLPGGGESGRQAVDQFFTQWVGKTNGQSIMADSDSLNKFPSQALLQAFRGHFFPELIAIDKKFEKLMSTYAIERHRRVVRQRLVTAMLITASAMAVTTNPGDNAVGSAAITIVRFGTSVILATLIATAVSRWVTISQAEPKHAPRS